MKRVVKADTNRGSHNNRELLLSSELFDLYKRYGVGTQDTPYTSYEVISRGDAEKYAVEIRIELSHEKFDGTPVEYQVLGTRISYGLNGRPNTDSDIRKFIEVLQAALEFEFEIKNYFGIG